MCTDLRIRRLENSRDLNSELTRIRGGGGRRVCQSPEVGHYSRKAMMVWHLNFDLYGIANNNIIFLWTNWVTYDKLDNRKWT